MQHQNIRKYNLVVFDVDGTLYNQPLLRLLMLIHLFLYYVVHLNRLRELKVLKVFRLQREWFAKQNEGFPLDQQYKRCAKLTNTTESDVKRIVQKWIYTTPLVYIGKCKYRNINSLISKLKTNQTIVCVYSDYYAADKVKKMGLEFDYMFCSEQVEINRIKPSPDGLKYIVSNLDVEKEKALMIGDRYETDGQCARNAGVDFLKVNYLTADRIFKQLKKSL